MERMTVSMALDNLCVNYGKYGVTRQEFYEMLKSGIEQGLSVRSTYNSIKMAIATHTGEHEYFSVEDIMDITGESREEVIARIEEMRLDMIAQGKNPDEEAIPVRESYKFTMIL